MGVREHNIGFWSITRPDSLEITIEDPGRDVIDAE